MSVATRTSMIVSGVLGSASALTHEMVGSHEVLSAPLALCRRVGFVQLRGGAGASATAGYLGSLLARRRTGMVLGVNASAGEANLLWHAGVPIPARSRDTDKRVHPASAADARAGLGVSATGLYGLDLAQDRMVASAGTWFERITPIARFYDVVLTDWGVRDRRVDLRQVAMASHVVCLVARADRHAAEEAAALVPALQEVEDRPRLVLVLVDVGRTGEYSPGLIRRQLDVPVLTIPYEPLRAAERPPASRELPARSRLAATRLATAVMVEAQRADLRRRSLAAMGRSVAGEGGPS
jgi:hypothetical protein